METKPNIAEGSHAEDSNAEYKALIASAKRGSLEEIPEDIREYVGLAEKRDLELKKCRAEIGLVGDSDIHKFTCDFLEGGTIIEEEMQKKLVASLRADMEQLEPEQLKEKLKACVDEELWFLDNAASELLAQVLLPCKENQLIKTCVMLTTAIIANTRQL